MTKLYIVNDTDRPCEELLAEMINNKLWYINQEKRTLYPAMSKGEATLLEDFGVVYRIVGNQVFGVASRKSTATYRDGSPRRWQGSGRFAEEMAR